MSKKKKEFKDIPIGDAAAAVEEYQRTRWKHYLRWLVFCWVLFLYTMLLMQSYHSHIILHKPFIIKELIAYVLCTVMLVPIVPSLVLEVDYAKVDDDALILQNLLMRKRELWTDMVKFWNPTYMKFAILKTKGFIYLLNRRDIPKFDKLVETIRSKSENLLN